ncbi:MAG: hypothetical protein ABI771_13260 [Betaproteobacteria bacterium]
MQRQILAQAAWRAVAAVAGFFTLSFAFASPVDLWNLTVKSRQGEPFLARVKIVSVPSERITTRCLSMGPESDAPGSEMPFLTQAILRLNSAGNVVTVSTGQVITSPGVELVLRVKCPGTPLYARHFTALIPPATSKAAKARVAAAVAKKSIASPTAQPASNPAPGSQSTSEEKKPPANPVAESSALDKSPVKRPGFHLKLLPGDTVESVATVLFPGKRALQQALVQKVLTGNPEAFPDGRSREIAAGTVLWFPDLPALRKTVPASAPGPDHAPAARGSDKVRTPQERAKSGGPVTLRQALALGDRPGPQECRQLLELCGAPAATAPASDGKFNKIESGMQQLHLKQDGIDQQLQRLEQSLLALQNTINNMPAHAAPLPAAVPAPAPAQPPAPPRVEIRTVVQSEPIEWYVWLALAAVVVGIGLAGFAYGRKGSFSRGLQETDEQLDRMLASGSHGTDEQLNRMMAGAADVMREFEANPIRVPPAQRIAAPPAPRPVVQRPVAPQPKPLPDVVVPPPPPIPQITFSEPEATTDVPWPSPVEPMHITNIASEPRIEPPVVVDALPGAEPAPPVAGLSNEVLFEMDQAMDNTRSMFTDVDRFIALGRIQNALSLLQFQVHKDPTDRDSWIKLLAIYRQEKMDTELTKAAREFKSHFPNESSPV